MRYSVSGPSAWYLAICLVFLYPYAAFAQSTEPEVVITPPTHAEMDAFLNDRITTGEIQSFAKRLIKASAEDRAHFYKGLEELLVNGDEKTRSFLAQDLHWFGEDASDILTRVYAVESEPRIRKFLLRSAFYMKSLKSLDYLIAIANDDNAPDAERHIALLAIGNTGGPKAENYLITALANPEFASTPRRTDTLFKAIGLQEQVTPELREALDMAMQGPYPGLAVKTIGCLASRHSDNDELVAWAKAHAFAMLKTDHVGQGAAALDMLPPETVDLPMLETALARVQKKGINDLETGEQCDAAYIDGVVLKLQHLISDVHEFGFADETTSDTSYIKVKFCTPPTGILDEYL